MGKNFFLIPSFRPFCICQGNQRALSSQDKFHIAVIIVSVCIEDTQTVKPRKEEGGKNTFD